MPKERGDRGRLAQIMVYLRLSETGSARHTAQGSGAVFCCRRSNPKRTEVKGRMSFEQFNLDAPLLRAVKQLGFEAATPIQAQAIPPALEGHDVMGLARTGTGQTAAFVLPSLQRLGALRLRSPLDELRAPSAQRGPGMLVLAPTRELAMQITEDARQLAQYTDMRVCAVYGGASLGRQSEQLRKGVDLIVATPGRLLDHMDRGHIRLGGLHILVLDEADRMLDMGFLPDIETIVRRMP